MPFQSQAQAGWAFSTGQPFARRWARETGPYKKLPKRVKRKTCMACVLASLKAIGAGPTAPAPRQPRVSGAAPKPAGGKGQQIAPGVTRIRGNLCNVHGRYGPCDAALSKQPKGRKRAAAPKKRAARAAQGRKPRAAVNPDQARRQAQRDAEHQQDRQARAQRQAARDTEHQQDRAARAQRQADADKKRAEAAAAKKPAAAAGGGGGKKKQPAARAARQTPEQRRDENRASVRQQMAATDTGLAPAGFDNLMNLAAGAEPDAQGAQSLIDMGLAERGGDGTLRLTGPGRVAVNAANRGDAKAAVDAISRGQDQASARQQRADERSKREAARAQREQERAAERAARTMRLPTPASAPVTRRRTPIVMPSRSNRGTRSKAADPGDYLVVEDREKPSTWHLQVKRNGKVDHGLMGSAWAALHSGFRGNTYQGPQKAEALAKLKKLYASEQMPVPSEKSFAVFKDASGAWRWLSRTTTAYEDRDSEVISTKALEDSAESAAPRGPLRWWHMGRPDPFSADRPWGPGVDLGWCDFAAVSGRTLIESGTFKSEALARAVAAHADDLELSPGFFHAAGEPDASGVFSHIRIFERSLVPKWAGRASNPYTGLVVEKTMDQKKIQALKELGASDEVITALLADVAQTEKSAEADGVRYKDARPVVDFFARLLRGEQMTTKEEAAESEPEPEPAPEPVDPIAALTATVAALQAEVASLKAAPVAEEKAGGMMGGDMMGGDMMDETPMEDTAEGGMEEPGEDAGGLTLSSEDLTAIGQVIAATLEPLIGALGITQKLEGHLGELKTMMSGYTKTKDDERAQLTARLDQTDAKVAELVGDAPRQGFRASSSAENTLQALVNTATLKDGSTPDPDNPFADLVEQLFGQKQR